MRSAWDLFTCRGLCDLQQYLSRIIVQIELAGLLFF
jgi:hypothetical protein